MSLAVVWALGGIINFLFLVRLAANTTLQLGVAVFLVVPEPLGFEALECPCYPGLWN